MPGHADMPQSGNPYDPVEFASILPEAVQYLQPSWKPRMRIDGPGTAAVKRTYFHAYLVELAFHHKLIDEVMLDKWDSVAIDESQPEWASTITWIIKKLVDPATGPIIQTEELERSKSLILKQWYMEGDIVFDWAIQRGIVEPREIRKVNKRIIEGETFLYCCSLRETERHRMVTRLEVQLIQNETFPDGIAGYLTCLCNILKVLPSPNGPIGNAQVLEREVERVVAEYPYKEPWGTIRRTEVGRIPEAKFEALLDSHMLRVNIGDVVPIHGPNKNKQKAAAHLHRAVYHFAHMIKYSDPKRATECGLDSEVEVEVQASLILRCLVNFKMLGLIDAGIAEAHINSKQSPKETKNSRFFILSALEHVDGWLHLKTRLIASLQICGLTWATLSENSQCSAISKKMVDKRKLVLHMLSKASIKPSVLKKEDRLEEKYLENMYRRRFKADGSDSE